MILLPTPKTLNGSSLERQLVEAGCSSLPGKNQILVVLRPDTNEIEVWAGGDEKTIRSVVDAHTGEGEVLIPSRLEELRAKAADGKLTDEEKDEALTLLLTKEG